MICIIATKYGTGAESGERIETQRNDVWCEVFSAENCSGKNNNVDM